MAGITDIQKIIPAKFADELLYWREQLTNGCWRVGDITNELYALVLANGFEIEKGLVCAAVGELVGKSGRTIRVYSSIASFYSPEIRQMYEQLPFSHFIFARQFPGEREGVPMWQVVLNTGMGFIDHYGIPPSIERLSGLFQAERESLGEPGAYEAPSLIGLPSEPFSDGGYIPDDETNYDDIPVSQVEVVDAGAEVKRILAQIDNLISPIPELLNRLTQLGVSAESIRYIAQALASLRMASEVVSGNHGMYVQPVEEMA